MVTALHALPDAEITAVGSRSQASADEFASTHGIARAWGSYDELFADPDVDIVYVASPHSHHREMTIAALDAGQHVLCEKAFAVNAAEAREMVDAARRNDRFLMEAMWTWFIPAVVELRDRIAAGSIGRLLTIEAAFGIRVDVPDGRHRRPDLAGGALLDVGIYPLTFACFLTGEHPTDVRAYGQLTPDGVDETFAGVASFPSGPLATFQASIGALSGHGARIVGTDGRVEVDAPFWHTAGFTIHRDGAEPERVALPNSGLAHEAAHAMARVRAGHRESDVIDLATTLRTMELLDDVRAQLGVVYPSES
ncbi:MAG: Gfo/Idh/MocA family oxidoreductase [Ilumatobacter sp.]|nr:Gfo/Idh/MocA family oxidoreductase [Ilumatobacter sp.]